MEQISSGRWYTCRAQRVACRRRAPQTAVALACPLTDCRFLRNGMDPGKEGVTRCEPYQLWMLVMLSGLVPTLSSGPEKPPILGSLESLAEATLSCVMI